MMIVVAFWLAALLLAGFMVWTIARARSAVAGLATEIRRREWRPPPGPDPLAEVDAYELAELKSHTKWGVAYTADTAIAVLYRHGQIRISRDGRISPVTGRQAPTAPLEQAVLRALAQAPARQLSAKHLREEVFRSTAMAELQQRIVDRGMLLPGSIAVPAWKRLRVLRNVSIAITALWVFFPLAALLLPRATWLLAGAAAAVTVPVGVYGLRRHGPWLRVVESYGFSWWSIPKSPPPVQAEPVHRFLRIHERRVREMSAAARAALPVALVVALGGLAVLRDPTLEHALYPPPEPAEEKAESTTGGSCGGGCGGCGGGCGCGG